jgi:antitoxin ParD1/3/4
METSSLTIVLPEPIKAFVEGQVAEGGYRSADEYIHTLIREAQKRKAKEKLEALLLEGLQSPASEMTPEDWESIRREGRQRIAARKSQ